MFDKKGITLKEVIEARKHKIAGDDAWELLGSAGEIIVGRGTKFNVLNPAQDGKEDIMKVCLGRTGNLRAPALKTGNRMIVGFNDEMYEEYFS